MSVNVMKKTANVFSWNVIGAAIGFFFQLFLAKTIGDAEYGKASLVFGASGTVAIFLTFGFHPLLVRNAAVNPKKAKTIFSQMLTSTLGVDIFVLPLTLSVLFIMLFNSGLYGWQYVIAAYLLIIFTQVSELIYGYYKGISRQEIASFTKDVAVRITKIAFFFLLIPFLGWTHKSLVAASLAPLLVMGYLASKNFTGKPKLDFTVAWDYMKQSRFFYLIAILYGLYGSLSKVLQGIYATSAVVGALSLGMTISVIVQMLGIAFTNVAMPIFSESWHKGDLKTIKTVFTDLTRWNAYLILPLTIFLLVNISRILGFLGWNDPIYPSIISVVLIAQFFNSFVGPNGTLLNMTHHEQFEVLNGAVGLITGILLGVILGPKYTMGVAISFAASVIIVNLMKFFEVAVIFGIYPYSAKVLAYLFAVGSIQWIVFKFISTKFMGFLTWLFISCAALVLFMIIDFTFSPIRGDRNALFGLLKKTKQR